MQALDGLLLLSPSDLTGFLACSHLTRLERTVARGELTRPYFSDPEAELIRRKGEEHEARYLARHKAAGRTVVAVPRLEGNVGPLEAARLTEEAIRAGEADVIYQAYFAEGAWRGFADFVERTPDGRYEPVETKLARAAKPTHLLQLCFYAEQLGRIQGRMPERVHVEPGTGERESFRVAELMAYYRQVRSRFLAAIDDSEPTYPWPCEHCSVCRWRRECHKQLVTDDHLVLVAGLGRSRVEPLVAAGLTTLTQLGGASRETLVEDLRPELFETFRHQAALQLHHRRTGEHRWDLLPDEEGRGFRLLPEPSPGDIWLDFEGYPFFEPARGLEYLFGYCYRDEGGAMRYEALRATDRAAEKQAFERLVDWIVERRRRFPGAHVYHYADYERSALKRLMGEHGTREDEVDDFLRGEVLVDLFRVTRQALRASVDSYSIKKIEALYGFERASDVTGGGESTVYFERWLQSGEPSLLEAVVKYNEEDCRSTVALHEWLLAQRPADVPWRPPPETAEVKEEAIAAAQEKQQVAEALLADPGDGTNSRWLLAQLLDYHQREARPAWWEWFHHLELDDDELLEDSHTIGGLELVGEPETDKLSYVYALAFPPQDHGIRSEAVDPATKKSYKGITVDDAAGRVTLRRAKKRADEPLPRGLIPPQPIPDWAQRDAVLRFARSHLAGDGAYAALEAVLERARPRADLTRPVPEAALTLERSYLIVQGPPGAGKTWQGARAAVALMRAGRRVGVVALSHKAIDNLLRQIEREATDQGFEFRGRKKHSREGDLYEGRFIEASGETEPLLDPGLQLIAGTSWLFAREEFDRSVDTLIVDEAGQVSLADAIASGTAARNLILLGDPNQLPQVSQGAHPLPAKASVLQHLLGENETVPPEMGIFLAETWRLRPEPCSFTSEAYYKGRLAPSPICAKRSVAAGDGLYVLAVEHEGCGQSSWQEARAVAEEIQRLLGTPFRREDGTSRPLGVEDMLVVAPYNAQVRALRSCVPAGVRVGTVDKFQGQEAPCVLVSFASSSGADAPRGIKFAFDRHRVNVATSRAQCRVVLVCEPRLLKAECGTVEQMRLMNAVCRFVEMANSGG